jgi:hypothetical protein
VHTAANQLRQHEWFNGSQSTVRAVLSKGNVND